MMVSGAFDFYEFKLKFHMNSHKQLVFMAMMQKHAFNPCKQVIGRKSI
jgi:hypothetical protein